MGIKPAEWLHLEKDDKGPGRGNLSTPVTRIPASRSTAAPLKQTTSSYTNPAYFIFEGVSVPRQVEEALPQRRDPQVIWSGNEALLLPKVSARPGFDRRACRRSDFTEIEIPAVLPQYTPNNDLQTTQNSSSYQLFPAKKASPIPPSKLTSNYQEQTAKPRDKYQGKNISLDAAQLEGNVKNVYMNHLAIVREKSRRNQDQVLPERTNPVKATKAPSAFSYGPAHATHRQASVPWTVDQQVAPPAGDNSLTALQIAKSLSEVDFFPTEMRGQRPPHRNGPSMHGDLGCRWEREASVLQGAPQTVRELLSALGLQKYTLGLRLNGWDNLDYFSGITEEDLCAAGVTNPSHRRRILENLPRNWN